MGPDPEPTGSSEPLALEEDNRATFPNNPDLVNNISNAALLKELLPALEKFHCLDAGAYKGKGSPWVRAFCDLYHPAGPWGENKFKNVPERKDKKKYNMARYTFKSYKIPKIFEYLEKCDHLEYSEVHRELHNKLMKFNEKEDFYNRCMEPCKTVAIQQSRKQPSERLLIPALIMGWLENEPEQTNPAQPNVDVILLDNEGREIGIIQGNATAHEQNDSVRKEQTAEQPLPDVIILDVEGNIRNQGGAEDQEENSTTQLEQNNSPTAEQARQDVIILDVDGNVRDLGGAEDQEKNSTTQLEQNNSPKPLPPLLVGEYDAPIPSTGKGLMMTVGDENGSVAFLGYRRLPDGSKCPAQTNNLIRGTGDRIIAVDGVSTANKTFQEVVELLQESGKKKFAFVRFLEVKFANENGNLTSFGRIGRSPETSDTHAVDLGNTKGPNAETVEDEDQEASEESNGTETTRNTVVSTNSADAKTTDQVSRNDIPLGRSPGLEQNKSPQLIGARINNKTADPSETIQEQATDCNCPDTSDIDAVEHDSTVGQKSETVDDEASVSNNSFGNDDEGSLGNDFEHKETSQVTNAGEPTQNTAESANSVDETTLDQDSTNHASLGNVTETSGEKRHLASSLETPSPKRQRVETNKPVLEEPYQPASPDPKQVSTAPARAVSPDTQHGSSDDRFQHLTHKREKLSNMVEQRTSLYGSEDRMIVKLCEKIDQIDEERLALIMAEE